MTTSANPVPTQQRLTALDALRGIAALCVVFQHAAQFTVDHTALYAPILDVINLGRFGVILFFLISGFVIPSSLERAGLTRFAWNRAFRLLPVLWVSALGLGVHYVLLGVDFSLIDLLANLTMLAWPLGRFPLSIGYWTLSVELGFYLLAALLFAMGRLRNFRLVGSCALVLALFGGAMNREVPVFYGYLLAGMVVRHVYDGNRAALPWVISLFSVLLVSDLQLALHAPNVGFLQPLALATGMIVPIPIFLYAAFRRPEPPRLLIWFGTISYPLYLLQDLALYSLLPITGLFAPAYPVAVLALAIAMAVVIHRTVEQPAVNLGRRLKRPRAAHTEKVLA